MQNPLKITILILFIVILSLNVYSQIATVDSVLCGGITKERFLELDSLTIIGDDNLKILSYEIQYRDCGFLVRIKTNNNRIPDSVKNFVKKNRYVNYILCFKNIYALTAFNDTVLLPPIIIQIINSFPFYQFVEEKDWRVIDTIKHHTGKHNYAPNSRATIAGVYNGEIKKSHLLGVGKIIIENNTQNLEIISFQFSSRISFGGTYISNSNYLTIRMKEVIRVYNCRSSLTFDYILAKNPKTGEIIMLNPIAFVLN
jgi:hypothetical protein